MHCNVLAIIKNSDRIENSEMKSWGKVKVATKEVLIFFVVCL